MDMSAYRTADLPEAAFLLSQPDTRFIGLEPRNERSYFFCFSPPARCQQLAMEFVSGVGTVNARAYADAMKRCKDLVFGYQRNGDRYAGAHL
jgi:hypothetical protein